MPKSDRKTQYKIQTAATAAGESVNGYIKKAIDAQLSDIYTE